jgi:uncharacterized protein YfaS (alpha-2-macroglobulin family)
MLKNWFINLGLIWLVAFATSLTAQPPIKKYNMKNYGKEWEDIQKFENQGLPKSALELTEKLYERIKADTQNPNREGHLIKAILFINKYQARLEEDGLVKAIARFEKEAEAATGATQAVLYSMVGEMYDQYLLVNLYKFRGRTATDADFKQDDIRTWDIRRITEKSYKMYKLSLADESSKKIETKAYDAVLNYSTYNTYLNPTMYDVLLNRALNFFMSERTHLTQPAYKFYIDQPEALGTAAEFMAMKVVARDTMSSQYQAMLVWQKLLAFHQKDVDIRAFVHADLRRLNYMRGKSVLPNKDELYISQLQNIEKLHGGHEASAEATYYLASYYVEQGGKYRPSPTNAYRYELRKALELINGIAGKFPTSYGAKNALVLKNSITSKSFSVQTEQVGAINQPLLALLNYKNVTELNYRMIELTPSVRAGMDRKYGDKLINYLADLPSKQSGSWTLPDEKDYQNHSVEVALPAMPNATYLLLVSYNKNFKADKGNAVNYTTYRVSNIAYLTRNVKGQQSYFVTDRRTGAPMESVKAEFQVQTYDDKNYKYRWEDAGTGTTDKNGFVLAPPFDFKTRRNNSGYFKVKFSTDKDVLDYENGFYQSAPSEPDYSRQTTHFFLDRAIYRPGQTVYFKGIMIATDNTGKNHTIVSGKATTVTFFDANYQKVADVAVTTNEYGSYHGSFIAPTSGMTGAMSIVDNATQSRKNFRVEEYKRPKFMVEMKPVDKVYRLNEKVTAKGVATAYAGNKIDGGKVQYRVTRQARFPYWSWRWGYNPYSQTAQEITFGETVTDENGEFSITFEAIPDKSIPAENKPEFTYTVTADVTDVTGETRSTSGVVRVGYIAINASLGIADKVAKETFSAIKISSTNLNGQYEAIKGKVVIEQLTSPTKVYHSRLWAKPDYYVLSENEFNEKFPYFAFKNEDDQTAWAVQKTVFTADIDTDKSKELSLKSEIKNWAQGTYRATLTTADKYGEKVESVHFFTVFSQTESTTPTPTPLYNMQTYYTVEPDSTVQIDFGTSNPNAYVLVQIEFKGTLLLNEWIQPKGRKSIPIKVEEKHRGGLHFQLISIQENRVYSESATVSVPWTNKELNIEYETFRDKLYPGQDEEWRIKISGHKGDKVAAEMVAGMYDASLDAFAANSWGLYIWGNNSPVYRLSSGAGFGAVSGNMWQDNFNPYVSGMSIYYAVINWYGFQFYEYAYYDNDYDDARVTSGGRGMHRSKSVSPQSAKKMMEKSDAPSPKGRPSMEADELEEAKEKIADGVLSDLEGGEGEDGGEGAGEFDEVKVRTNLNETVFFFPQMMTDKDGKLIIKFKMNEALTKWKFMLLGHTKDLAVGQSTREVVTQKDLMVQPNAPRFFRQSDEIEFTAKISNLTDKAIKGKVVLQLFDASTLRTVDAEFANSGNTQDFAVEGNRSVGASWKLKIPADWTSAITFRAIAKAGNFSDGEESSLPVVTNRMLVTETMPLPIRAGQTKVFNFGRMAEASKSTTLRHHQYTLEFTQNPAWYAVQALPYLMEYPYECTEQIFSRFYANSLSTSIANAHPRIKQVFDQWKNIDPNALKSNLHKNQELKYALLEETPWVLAAESEEQQKKNIGLLFDLNRMANELGQARDKMAERQLGNGGFAWFPGDRDSWYVTQYIVEGMGHLKEMKVDAVIKDSKITTMISKAVKYTDVQLERYYKDLMRDIKRAKGNPDDDYLSQMAIHYLYARSFYLDIKVTDKGTQEAIDYFEGQAKKYWLNKSMYMQGMIALATHRKGAKDLPKAIVKSLKENSLNSEEMGMYWKYPSGYSWYELPIETHALMIEVFEEVAEDAVAVDDLKTWLIKGKQTTHWKTTKATAAACYALLRRGANWLAEDKTVAIKIGDKPLDMSKIKQEAGTGYFKTTWAAQDIKPEMAKVEVTNPNKVVAWGAIYWQYFEQLDKITHFKETPLKINKQLFKEVRTDVGPKLVPLTNGAKLNVGDLIKVRIEIFVDRDMEYVHLKDMRASGFEPTNVLSQYKYQGGLGYYESTRDLATNFFISYLSKGTYVFEYPLRVQHKGNFSNGITTIQCMYAPEFTAHSEGIRVTVD